MGENKAELLRGTLDLMVLKTLETLGPLHGYGIARRLEQVSGQLLAMNQGTLYPALLRIEQRGWIRSCWGASENNRRARYYSLTAKGRRQLAASAREWEQMTALMARVLAGGEHA
ncbi:MAG TPA: PadR family transcriptional regulator [Terriglobales bacterium]|nr:PadR family transcriptional regulator [Terriglobales bacterium]